MRSIAMARPSRELRGPQPPFTAIPLSSSLDGVPFDNQQTVPESNIGGRITRLTSRRMKETAAAVSFALGLEE